MLWPSPMLEINSSCTELLVEPRKDKHPTVKLPISISLPCQRGGARYSCAKWSSSGSGGPAIIRSNGSKSSACRQTMPIWQMRHTAPWNSSKWVPTFGQRPPVGLWPNKPLSSAGILVEPPISAVSPTDAPQDATRAAVPPLEPPGVRWAPQGLEVLPYTKL